MAFPTADVWIGDITLRFFAIGRDLDPALEQRRNRPGHRRGQFLKFTGVGTRDPRHRARPAEIPGPALIGSFQQAAFLEIPPAIVITIEIGTFRPGRSSHNG